MKELKNKMIIEINDYTRKTKDYDLCYFQSQHIINYMTKNKIDLMWYPTLYNGKQVIDIAISVL